MAPILKSQVITHKWNIKANETGPWVLFVMETILDALGDCGCIYVPPHACTWCVSKAYHTQGLCVCVCVREGCVCNGCESIFPSDRLGQAVSQG